MYGCRAVLRKQFALEAPATPIKNKKPAKRRQLGTGVADIEVDDLLGKLHEPVDEPA